MVERAREDTDGRHQRSEASRERIVQALSELVAAGDALPSAEAVATRAGVGLRTVFRHFDNMEGLYQHLDTLITAEILPIVARPLAPGDWKAQISEIIERRIGIFERIMPFKIAGDLHRRQSPFLAARAQEFVRLQRAAFIAVLPKARHDDFLFCESLDLLLSFDTWRRLRKEQKLSRPKARTVLQNLVGALLGGQ